MAKQKLEKQAVEVKSEPVVEEKKDNTQTIETPKESIEVEVVESRSLSGEEKKVTKKLVAKKVFEAMQGVHKTVWVEE